jgi:acyl-CoA reductase-like NAD-dependent aldehyde dehydrogenase
MARNETTNRDHASSKFDISLTIPLWLDGKEVTTSKSFDVTSPITHKVPYQATAGSEDDTVSALVAAENSFKSWSNTEASVRRDVFLKAAEEFARCASTAAKKGALRGQCLSSNTD